MLLVVCAVYDSAAQLFNRPMFVPAVGMANRVFRDEVNRAAEDNPMFRHPDDFELFELGSFDDSTGRFHVLDDPRPLARGKDVREGPDGGAR